MEIIKKKLARRNWTAALRGLKMEEECLTAPIEHASTIRTMATRLSQKEGLYFTFEANGDRVNVWKIPVPARKYKKICSNTCN